MEVEVTISEMYRSCTDILESGASVGENFRFNSRDAVDIVLELVLDDGLASRGQRKNVLNKDFAFIGKHEFPA